MSGMEHQIGLRCSDQQMELWTRAAELDRRKLNDWIRLRLDDAAEAEIEAKEKSAKPRKRD